MPSERLRIERQFMAANGRYPHANGEPWLTGLCGSQGRALAQCAWPQSAPRQNLVSYNRIDA